MLNKMLKIKAIPLLVVSFLSLCFVTSLSVADDHGGEQQAGPRISAIESYYCSYAKNKDMDDLLKTAAIWDDWADDNFPAAYTAYVLSPVVTTEADFPFDLVWLGVAKNQQTLGKINDAWLAKGADMAKKFDAVTPCNSHGYLTSIEARPYPNLGQMGYLQIQACQYNEGKTLADVMAADMKWTAWMDENGMPGGIYRWIPSIGSPRADKTNFFNVYITDSLAQRGQAHDMMLNGGFAVRDTMYNDIAVCDNPRVWHAQPVGGKSAG